MNDQSAGFKQIQTSIIEYSEVAAGLAELHRKYAGVVYDVKTREGLEEAKAARAELRKVRTSLEEKRKEIKAPALARAKAIDTEAKEIEEVIVSLEQPIAQQIEAERRREEEEKRARAEAEQRRVQAIMERVNDIKLTPARLTGQSADAIEVGIERLRSMEIGENFAEFQREAEMERTIAISTLTNMVAGAKAQEAEAARIAAEREELARLRKEGEERRAREEADRKARIEAEEAAAREKRAREDAEAKAERERLDREAREKRDAEAAKTPVQPAGIPAPEEQAARAQDFDRVICQSDPNQSKYSITLTALKRLHELLLPGSEEAEIVEAALREVGEL